MLTSVSLELCQGNSKCSVTKSTTESLQQASFVSIVPISQLGSLRPRSDVT